MNPTIKRLAEQAGMWVNEHTGRAEDHYTPAIGVDLEKFTDLLIQAIYDDVKADLIEDEFINEEDSPLSRQYLHGSNGGTTDALYRISVFNKDRTEYE